MILEAAAEGGESAAKSLEQLCETYWFPLYAYARRRGLSIEDAEDVTQGFFQRLLEKGYLRNADPRKGKFRAYLITGFRNFITEDWRRRSAEARGGKVRIIAIDSENAEALLSESGRGDIEEQLAFDHDWAISLFRRALSRLRAECADKEERQKRHEVLSRFLTDNGDAVSYREAARVLGMSDDSVKMSVSRMRRRFKEVLREEVAHTVAKPEDLEEEFRYLVRFFRSGI